MIPAMTSDIDWAGYHRATAVRPAKDLLRRALGLIQADTPAPGRAIDLGFGAGAGTLELLRRGWHVQAIDSAPSAAEALLSAAPIDHRDALSIATCAFGGCVLDAADLVWAGVSLPFCDKDQWPHFWASVVAALKPGGRFAGDFFGERHAWARDADILSFTEPQVRALFAAFDIEVVVIDEGLAPTSRGTEHWHAYGVVARKR